MREPSKHPSAGTGAEHSNRPWITLAIVAGAIAFYLPFLSKEFMGDDWLWLLNVRRASVDLSVFLDRPMYGYFRPLNLLIVSGWFQLFGARPILFSLMNVLLHGLNVWLLWKTIKRFTDDEDMAIVAAFIFGFYYLNCSAIEWISVGHDLWVTAFSLIVAIKSADFADDCRLRHFIWIVSMGAAATLTKESGFVTIGIYFAVLLLKGRSPVRGKYLSASLILIAAYLAYLIPYFLMRTVADREVRLGVATVSNLLYFLVYLVLPFSKRVAALVPPGAIWVLQLLKVIGTIGVLLLAYRIWTRGGVVTRLFLLWSIMFLSTIAILDWDVGLFDIYPQRTATRFMYSPAIGLAACLAWIVVQLSRRLKWLTPLPAKGLLLTAYLVCNFLIIGKVSGEYRENQELTRLVLQTFEPIRSTLSTCDSLLVSTDRIESTPQLISSGVHLQAILAVQFNRDVTVRVVEGAQDPSGVFNSGSGTCTLRWSTVSHDFVQFSP